MRGSSRLLALTFALGCAPARVEPRPPPPPEPSTPRPLETPVAPDTAPPGEHTTWEPPPPEPEVPAIPETGHAFQEPLPPRELARDAPAIRFANFSAADCAGELRRRKLPVERDRGPAQGIAVPVRITGEMQGIRFLPPGRKSVYGKLDCRLSLAFDELARVLGRHGVVAVRIDNLYRPRARLPGRRTQSQHRYGLAIDLVSLELANGTELSVERDWHVVPETPPCGPDARVAERTLEAIALRNIVCDVARNGIFHHILTPSYNEAHRDHLHLDIKRGEKRGFIG